MPSLSPCAEFIKLTQVAHVAPLGLGGLVLRCLCYKHVAPLGLNDPMIFTFHASRITLSTAANSTIDYHLLLTFYIRNGDLRSLQLARLNNPDE